MQGVTPQGKSCLHGSGMFGGVEIVVISVERQKLAMRQIKLIADQRMSQVGEVDSDLMVPTRERPATDQRGLGESLQDFIPGFSGLLIQRFTATGHQHMSRRRSPTNRRVDQTRILINSPLNQSDIRLGNATILKGCG
jgi:hypothetical protein